MTADDEVAERVWTSLRAVVLERYDRRREVSQAIGMSYVRVKALRHLVPGPRTMTQLAAELATDAPYATIIVGDLEARGLLERTIDPADRRRKLVSLTTAGRRLARTAERLLAVPPAPLRALPARDLAALDRITAALLATSDDAS